MIYPLFLLLLPSMPHASAGQGPVDVEILEPRADLLLEDWAGVGVPLLARVSRGGAPGFQGWSCTWRLDQVVLGTAPVAEDGLCEGWLDLTGARVGVHRLSVSADPPPPRSGPELEGFGALFVRLVNGMPAQGVALVTLEGMEDCPEVSATGRGVCWDLLIEDGVPTTHSGLPARLPGAEGGDPLTYEFILEFGESRGGDVSLGTWSGNLGGTATALVSGQEALVLPTEEGFGWETCSADWRIEAVVGGDVEAPEPFVLHSSSRLEFTETTEATFTEEMSGTGAGPFLWSAGDADYPRFSFLVTLADPVLTSGMLLPEWTSDSGSRVDGCDSTSAPGTFRCHLDAAGLDPGSYTLSLSDTIACLAIEGDLVVELYEPEVVDNDFDGATESGLDHAGAAVPLDCDDEDASVFEGAVELCSTVDEDCDGAVNGGLEYEADVDEAANDRRSDATWQLDEAGDELATVNDDTLPDETPDLSVDGNLVDDDDVDWYRVRLEEGSDDADHTVSFELDLLAPCESTLPLDTWSVDLYRSRIVYDMETLPVDAGTLLLANASSFTACDADGRGHMTWTVEGDTDPTVEREEIWWLVVQPSGSWDPDMCGTDPADPTPMATYTLEIRD